MLEWTLSRGYNSWCFGLQTFNLRPDSSLIFKYCLNGNIDGVKRLIEDSLASPYDVDSQGATPLHVCVQQYTVHTNGFLTGND